MALQQTDYYYDYHLDPGLTRRLLRSQLNRIGINDDDAGAWNGGYARLWVDDPAQPGQYWRKVTGAPVLDLGDQRVEQVNSWVEWTPEQKRAALEQEIDQQIFQMDAQQLVEDPVARSAVTATSGGAANRRADLEDTDDAGLDAFDPAIVPSPLDGHGVVQGRMTFYIDVVDPWAGDLDAIYAGICALEVLNSATGDEGQSARAQMLGPNDGAGAVTPFTRDADNPMLWWAQTEQGRYWDDPETPASMRLLWDDGSRPVDKTANVRGYGEGQGKDRRYYATVRYGTGARRINGRSRGRP